MPLGEIAGGIIEIFWRLIAQLFIEILVKGSGYIIVKTLTFPKPKEVNPDGGVVLFAGIVFLVLIGFGIFWGYTWLAS